MPDYRFCLERGNIRSPAIAFDLPDVWAVSLVAKQVARSLAARELGTGHLHLEQDIMVLDAEDVEVARYPLVDFLLIEPVRTIG
ncbi:hypothetical protein [Aurantiacibacter zhengii]|uniref:DUF6894 domain-containing protein n=1 Tax=Aurantiacibacter zhengii TaxID=2307003 RepID=A0A418NP91_9SPHN|nr:hypothetical protein [Aurantiacibacter zhengii]RIV83831.1 hypothetical protein D2V07_15175 [Aurantiacibacter zhengii]